MIGRQVGGVGFWKSHGLRFQLPESPFWRKVWEFVDLGRCWRGRGEGEEEEKRKKEGGGISHKFDTSARRRRGHGGAVRTSADQCGISECRCAASLALKFFFISGRTRRAPEPLLLHPAAAGSSCMRRLHSSGCFPDFGTLQVPLGPSQICTFRSQLQSQPARCTPAHTASPAGNYICESRQLSGASLVSGTAG